VASLASTKSVTRWIRFALVCVSNNTDWPFLAGLGVENVPERFAGRGTFALVDIYLVGAKRIKIFCFRPAMDELETRLKNPPNPLRYSKQIQHLPFLIEVAE
jgi:hypothetical protein